MVKVNVSRTQFSLSIAISVALTPNLRKLNFSQISSRISESFEYVGPDCKTAPAMNLIAKTAPGTNLIAKLHQQ